MPRLTLGRENEPDWLQELEFVRCFHFRQEVVLLCLRFFEPLLGNPNPRRLQVWLKHTWDKKKRSGARWAQLQREFSNHLNFRPTLKRRGDDGILAHRVRLGYAPARIHHVRARTVVSLSPAFAMAASIALRRCSDSFAARCSARRVARSCGSRG